MQCCTSFLLELGKIKTWQSIDLDQVGDRDVERKDSHESPHTHTHTFTHTTNCFREQTGSQQCFSNKREEEEEISLSSF